MNNNVSAKVLVADNDEDVLIALEGILEEKGYSTSLALSSAEACALLCKGDFDLLILDDCLSDAHSIQTLAACRSAGISTLAVVTYHRFPSFDEEARLRDLGVSALVNKQAHAELIEIVSHLLKPHSLAKQWTFETIT
jgi:DNA-binding NtrC family response regulator